MSKFNPKQFGLILRKPKSATTSSAPGSSSSPSSSSSIFGRKPAAKPQARNPFGADSDDDDDNGSSSIQAQSGSHQSKVNKELRSIQSAASRSAEIEQAKALEEDPTVFDYDGVYDDMKKAEKERKKAISDEASAGKEGGARKQPKYIQNILRAAELRKVERERAEQRKIQRERAEEGDEFEDKEKFVTAAFKARQEELRKLEEEEKRREEMENDVTKRANMTGFYRNLLNHTDRGPVVLSGGIKPSEEEGEKEGQEDLSNNGDEDIGDKERSGRIRAAIDSGAVRVNDSDEVVDKRQLLSAGLNVSKKKVQALQREKEEAEAARRAREEELRAQRLAKEEEARRRRKMREEKERALEFIEKQKGIQEEVERKRKEEEKLEVAKKMAKRATEETISDAKARYLARKRAQQAKEKEGDDD
ncbi:hypothetical protein HK102_002151 [Quaeritorhiza haematococci]|nr:hypothetical protein HK102_002151 [Quaeritorhiza haematococci]